MVHTKQMIMEAHSGHSPAFFDVFFTADASALASAMASFACAVAAFASAAGDFASAAAWHGAGLVLSFRTFTVAAAGHARARSPPWRL